LPVFAPQGGLGVRFAAAPCPICGRAPRDGAWARHSLRCGAPPRAGPGPGFNLAAGRAGNAVSGGAELRRRSGVAQRPLQRPKRNPDLRGWACLRPRRSGFKPTGRREGAGPAG